MDLKIFDGIMYHDAAILRYENKKNDAVLELIDECCDSDIVRFTFKNVKINEDIDERIAFDLRIVREYLDTGKIGIFSADSKITDDNKYYLQLELTCIPDNCFDYTNLGCRKINYQGEIFYNEEYYEEEYPTMSFVADDVIREEISRDTNMINKYDRNSEYFKNNYSEISSVVNNDVLNFINDFYLFRYACFDDNNNLMLYFKDDFTNPNKFVYVKLIDAEIQLLDNDRSDEFVVVNKIHHIINSWHMRFNKNSDSTFEIGFLISEIREIIVKCSDIQCGEYDNNKLENIIKVDYINRINFHDGDMYNYKRDINNISFELKDGWDYDTYYKFELKNVRVQVMNNNPELICFVLNRFNSLMEDDEINLYSGECGMVDGTDKYYLKLWIRHPNVFDVELDAKISEYKFDGIDVTLTDDYDDTGMLYIKFIVDSINVVKL